MSIYYKGTPYLSRRELSQQTGYPMSTIAKKIAKVVETAEQDTPNDRREVPLWIHEDFSTTDEFKGSTKPKYYQWLISKHILQEAEDSSEMRIVKAAMHAYKTRAQQLDADLQNAAYTIQELQQKILELEAADISEQQRNFISKLDSKLDFIIQNAYPNLTEEDKEAHGFYGYL